MQLLQAMMVAPQNLKNDDNEIKKRKKSLQCFLSVTVSDSHIILLGAVQYAIVRFSYSLCVLMFFKHLCVEFRKVDTLHVASPL